MSITRQIGIKAAEAIAFGNPEFVDGYIYLWLEGIECSYAPGTNPPLFQICESNKEFTNFDDLEAEIMEEKC